MNLPNRLKLFFLLFPVFLFAQMEEFRLLPDFYDSTSFMKINILDTKYIQLKTKKGKTISELSDLAYCNNILYAISDRGNLYHFNIKMDKKIRDLKLLQSFSLRDGEGEKLRGTERDSEGLAVYGDKLLISFERNQRVALYSKNGIELKKMKLNKKLRDKSRYIEANKGLEAVTYNDKYGLITIPEEILKGVKKKKYHTLYAKKKVWRFKADGDITSIEFIDKNTLLILLRKYRFMGNRFTSLVRVHLDRCNKKRVCQSELLAKFDSFRGWHIDNFEGLCKVDKNRYLMISDDNGSFFQKTLLVLFEIID